MNEQETILTINNLEAEIEKLKREKKMLLSGYRHIATSVKHKKELDFLYPLYNCDMHNNRVVREEWRRSNGYSDDFAPIREAALIATYLPPVCEFSGRTKFSIGNKNGYWTWYAPRKFQELSREERIMVVECADEIIKIVAKYRKDFLLSIGREDVIQAFGM